MNIGIVLILCALIFALMEAFNVFPHPRVRWGWLGVSFWFASLLIGGARLL